MATTAIDPVCGMTVGLSDSPPSAEHEGQTYYFCASGCRKTFLKDPGAFLHQPAGETHGCGHCDHH